MTPIYQMKLNFISAVEFPKTSNQIKKAFYDELHSISKIIFSANKNEDPNYELLLHKINRLMTIAGTSKGQCYDWCPENCPHNNSYQKYWDVLTQWIFFTVYFYLFSKPIQR